MENAKNVLNETNDPRFLKLMELVFESERKVFTNNPNDYGKETMYGLTQIGYDEYCRTRNLPHKEVKNLNENEIVKVYYEDYYKKSGADKAGNIADAYAIFDTAVNFHPVTAKKMWDESGKNFYKMLDIRRKSHKNNAKRENQKGFLEGWMNRVNKVEKIGTQMLKDENPKFYNQPTPFDENYEGAFKKVNEKLTNEERDKKRTKYLYMLNKKEYPTGFASEIDKQLFNSLSGEQIGKASSGEYGLINHIVNNQINRGLINKNMPDIAGYFDNLGDGQTLYTSELMNALKNETGNIADGGLTDLLSDFADNIGDAQIQQDIIGLPSDEDVQSALNSNAGGEVEVRAYERDGVHVRAYTRRRPSR